jgi:hypothetical protein
VPRYEPEMLYVENYAAQPISYYTDPYPSYYYPSAGFWAGAVTGAFFAAAIDWDDWGVWGGDWGDDVDLDIDCNNCFNDRDFNGKINFNDVDWKNIDRSKINIDRNQFNKVERDQMKNRVKANTDNSIGDRAKDIKKRDIWVPIVAGIWPLVSARNAEFMANEVPGVIVPKEIVTRMQRANEKSKEHALQEGIAIAREMFERVQPYVQGLQVSAPFGRVAFALQVFEGIDGIDTSVREEEVEANDEFGFPPPAPRTNTGGARAGDAGAGDVNVPGEAISAGQRPLDAV